MLHATRPAANEALVMDVPFEADIRPAPCVWMARRVQEPRRAWCALADRQHVGRRGAEEPLYSAILAFFAIFWTWSSYVSGLLGSLICSQSLLGMLGPFGFVQT